MVTDIFPALALGVGKGAEGVMKSPPRQSDEPILTKNHWAGIIIYGLIITASVIGSLFIALRVLELEYTGAVTISFLTLTFVQLWHVFNMRDRGSGIFNNTVVQSVWIWGALTLCVIITLAAIYVPAIAYVLKIEPPSLSGWGVILGMSIIPLVLGQLWKILRN